MNILQNSALPSGSRIICQPFTFQQNNDPYHTTQVQDLLEERRAPEEIALMIWLPQSPNPSLIMLLRDERDRISNGWQPQNAQRLWEYLSEIWQQIDHNYMGKLISKMSRMPIKKKYKWCTKYIILRCIARLCYYYVIYY